MSYGILLKTDCPHEIVDEAYEVLDRKRVCIKRFVLNIDSFVLKLNGYKIDTNDVNFGYGINYIEGSDSFEVEFKRQLPCSGYMVELSYITSRQNCPRCLGLGKEFDPKFSQDGKLYTVVNREKLAQQIEKWIITEKGSHRYRSIIGTDIISYIGQKSFSSSDLLLKKDIMEALMIIRRVHASNSRIQQMSDEEMLGEIILVEAFLDEVDPRLLNIEISYKTQEAEANTEQVGAKFRTDFRRD